MANRESRHSSMKNMLCFIIVLLRTSHHESRSQGSRAALRFSGLCVQNTRPGHFARCAVLAFYSTTCPRACSRACIRFLQPGSCLERVSVTRSGQASVSDFRRTSIGRNPPCRRKGTIVLCRRRCLGTAMRLAQGQIRCVVSSRSRRSAGDDERCQSAQDRSRYDRLAENEEARYHRTETGLRSVAPQQSGSWPSAEVKTSSGKPLQSRSYHANSSLSTF